MMFEEWISSALVCAGAFFYLAGTLGMLRFPDIYTRLHAVTKEDNLGLGLLAAGLMLRAESWPAMIKLALIWMLALVTSATACYLVANNALRAGLPPVLGRYRSGSRP